MQDAFIPTVFQRHHNSLRAVMIDQQPWFVASDFGRLISQRHAERLCRRMDEDQIRTIRLRYDSGNEEQLQAINEAGIYKCLFRFPHPENRAISRWLSHEVIPALRDQQQGGNGPRRLFMAWDSKRVSVLEWQGELWIPLHALPSFSPRQDSPPASPRRWPRLLR